MLIYLLRQFQDREDANQPFFTSDYWQVKNLRLTVQIALGHMVALYFVIHWLTDALWSLYIFYYFCENNSQIPLYHSVHTTSMV